MPIFANTNGRLLKIKENPFDLEKDIHKLTEDNLQLLFNLQLVRAQFELNDLKIDSLAYDTESKSFVIIEYKKDKNFSVIDQGFAYLALMLNNKADFVLEYNERFNGSLKKENVDWTQSKVIFISPSFTNYQQKAIHFKDLPIELWEIKKFENKIILYNQLKSPEKSESINTISQKSEVVKKVSREVKLYMEDDHTIDASENLKEIYQKLKENVLNLGDDIEIVPRKEYVAFKRKSNFVDVEFQKSKIKVFINLSKGQLDDPKKIARDVSNIGHWGNGDYEVSLSNLVQINYLITLIRQSYDKNV